MPRFSVIIPLYNKAGTVKRAIASVSAQSYRDWEITVIDDGSSDPGPDIVRSLNLSNLQIIHQPNSGVSQARNAGIQLATGEYIAFLDADDAWHPLFLETIAHLVQQYPHAGAYATGYDIVEMDGKQRPARFYGIPPFPWAGIIPNFPKSLSRGSSPIWTSAVVVPKRIFQNIGYFKEGLSVHEDTHMWLRIGLYYPVALNTHILSTYYRDSENRACHIHRPKLQELPSAEVIRDAIIKKVLSFDDIQYLNEFEARFFYLQALSALLFNDRPAARRFLKKVRTHQIDLLTKAFLVWSFSWMPFGLIRLAGRILWKDKREKAEH